MHFVGGFFLYDVFPVGVLPLRVPDRAVLFFDAF